jgi:hypothetical protein
MKRSDITDEMVCRACLTARTDSRATVEILVEMTGGTPKLCLRAIERAISHDLCDSEISDRHAFLTGYGEQFLAELTQTSDASPPTV